MSDKKETVKKILVCYNVVNEPQFSGRLKKVKFDHQIFLRLILNDLKKSFPEASTSSLLVAGNHLFKNPPPIGNIYRYSKKDPFFSKVRLVLSLRRQKFDIVVLVYNSVNRLPHLFSEFIAFILKPKRKIFYEPSLLDSLRKSSLTFKNSKRVRLQGYNELLADYRNMSFDNTAMFKKAITLKEISIFYTLKNFNLVRIFAQILLRFLYLLILLSGAAFFFIKNINFILFKRRSIVTGDTLIDEYYFLPTYAFTKTVEATYFRSCTIKSTSLEIGIENGKISNMIFGEDQKIDCGMEYYYPTLPQKGECSTFKNYLSGDIFFLPFKDESLSTVIMVHTMDHFEGIERAITEITRILKKGGHLYFSCYSGHYYYFSPISRILLKLGLWDVVGKRRRAYSERYKVYNFLSIADWERIFRNIGLKNEYHGYFVTANVAFWFTFLEKVGYFIGHLYPVMGIQWLNQTLAKLTKIILYPYMIEEKKAGSRTRGNNIFIATEKSL